MICEICEEELCEESITIYKRSEEEGKLYKYTPTVMCYNCMETTYLAQFEGSQ